MDMPTVEQLAPYLVQRIGNDGLNAALSAWQIDEQNRQIEGLAELVKTKDAEED